MRKYLRSFVSVGCLAAATLHVGAQTSPVSLIPEPASMTVDAGTFTLPSSISIEAPSDPSLGVTLENLKVRLAQATGYGVSVTGSNAAATIRLVLDKKPDTTLGAEGYELKVTPTSVLIHANKAAGLFYGTQSFLQLLPAAIESSSPVKDVAWQAPCATIKDYPRFKWRGLMLDVSRHFFTPDEVKKFIDQMVKYKFNLLHWHLTDDEGWRVEIKSLPKLTSVGAWNTKRVGTFGTFSKPTPDEKKDYGGFYTQEDIKEIVLYAKQRFVDVLPEVDIPGHSLSAIVAYPELSCTPGADTYQVRSGEKIMDWHKGGFTALIDNTLCPANEKVYPFLDKVFGELSTLFPFGFIHIGGDECAKNFWEQSDAVKALMKKEKLKNMQEVQSYFEKRVEKIVESKGKKVIGWDEILEGGLAPNAAVMSWRGIAGGIEAAKLGHQVVMSPTTFVYLDYMQGDATIEPPVYATLRLKTTYSFEPVPDGVDPKLVLGGQANLWTEQVYNTRHMQYMLWPRSLAVSESVWSPKEKKDWDKFVKKTEAQFGRFDYEQVKYARSMYDANIDVKKDVGANDSVSITLTTEINGLDIHYSWDNSNPDNFYPKASGVLNVPKDAAKLKVITYRDGKPIGRQIDITVDELKRRVGLSPVPPRPAD